MCGKLVQYFILTCVRLVYIFLNKLDMLCLKYVDCYIFFVQSIVINALECEVCFVFIRRSQLLLTFCIDLQLYFWLNS